MALVNWVEITTDINCPKYTYIIHFYNKAVEKNAAYIWTSNILNVLPSRKSIQKVDKNMLNEVKSLQNVIFMKICFHDYLWQQLSL